MFLSDLFGLSESVLPLRGGRSVNLARNASLDAIFGLLSHSEYEEVRGLIIGTDVFWWDASEATHADVAQYYDPDFADFANVMAYRSHRLALKKSDEGTKLYSGTSVEGLKQNPRLNRLVSKLEQDGSQIIVTLKNF